MRNDEYLYHHGIKGQKWGVRRYQNPDGSYTAAGRKRYGIAQQKLLDNNRTSRLATAAGKAVVAGISTAAATGALPATVMAMGVAAVTSEAVQLYNLKRAEKIVKQYENQRLSEIMNRPVSDELKPYLDSDGLVSIEYHNQHSPAWDQI